MPQVWQSTPRKRILLAAARALSKAVDILRPESRRKLPNVDIKSILVVELWNIGDVILAMPFLAQLRAVFPGARITLLSRPFARELLEGTGLVDEFVTAELTWRGRSQALDPIPPHWRELWSTLRKLRRLRFDLGFSSRLHLREHAILRLAKVRRRIGYGFGSHAGLLTDAISIADPDQHKVADWLALLDPFGGPLPTDGHLLRVSPAERDWAENYLVSNGVLEGDVVVGVHPGASLIQKRWPIERFADVVQALNKCPGVRTLVFVEPTGHGATLSESHDVITAKVGLREMIALIDRCELLVCNDSGPMHIAGALGIPAVAIFLSGINRWFSPLGEHHELVSGDVPPSGDAGYHTARIDEVPASRVIEATMRLLATKRRS
jgi:lipopolysaccharide heptosyltransferase II